MSAGSFTLVFFFGLICGHGLAPYQKGFDSMLDFTPLDRK
jgi:hypothetical protein